MWSKGHILNEKIQLGTSTSSNRKLASVGGSNEHKIRTALHVMSPEISSPSMAMEILDHFNDDYEGIIINSESLPSNSNAFSSALQASLFHGRLKGEKMGVAQDTN